MTSRRRPLRSSSAKLPQVPDADGTVRSLKGDPANVPRRSKFRISKTNIRHLFRRLAQYGIDEVDLFREQVKDSSVARQQALQRRAEALPPEAQEFLADEIRELDIISSLADQLAIVALYRVVEINIDRMLAHAFGRAVAEKATSIVKVKQLLQLNGIDLEKVPYYSSIEKLRKLNNEIKHEDHRWHEDVAALGEAYRKLSPKVPAYIFRLAERMKLRYK